MDKTMEARKKNESTARCSGYWPICGEARYSPAGRRAGGGASAVGESEDKVKETKGDSLEQKKKL